MILTVKLEVMFVTVDNLEAVASWGNGQVKGSKLPPEKRVVDFPTNTQEYRAAVGDAVIKLRGVIIGTFPPKEFNRLFGISGENK